MPMLEAHQLKRSKQIYQKMCVCDEGVCFEIWKIHRILELFSKKVELQLNNTEAGNQLLPARILTRSSSIADGSCATCSSFLHTTAAFLEAEARSSAVMAAPKDCLYRDTTCRGESRCGVITEGQTDRVTEPPEATHCTLYRDTTVKKTGRIE